MRRSQIVILVCLLFTGLGTSVRCCQPQGAALTPRPKVVEVRNTARVPVGAVQVAIDSTLRNRIGVVVDSVEATVRRVVSDSAGRPLEIAVGVFTPPCRYRPEVCQALGHPEAYALRIRSDSLVLDGADTLGVVHGLTTLQKLLEVGNGSLPRGRILDWPDLAVRGVDVIAWRLSLDDFRREIELARRAQMNTLVVEIHNWVRFDSVPRLSGPRAWSTEEFLEGVEYARQVGLEVVPEVELLTHQEAFLGPSHPELLYNRDTYDPRKPAVYDSVVFPLLDQIIQLVHPRAIHIGHDEVAGVDGVRRSRPLPRGQQPLPASLFLNDVAKIHDFLSLRAVETWMWGDMLLDSASFPGMNPKNLHGTAAYAALLHRLPSDIVVCDWHYSDQTSIFSSADSIASAGHDVIGATWNRPPATRRFSAYIGRLGSHGRGMLATTWSDVQNGDWKDFEGILSTASEAFWNATTP